MNRMQLGLRLAVEGVSVIETGLSVEVRIPMEYMEYLDRSLVRLGYLFPEFQVTRNDCGELKVQVHEVTGVDIEAFTRELLHALAREKCWSEGQPLRRMLLEHIFEK